MSFDHPVALSAIAVTGLGLAIAAVVHFFSPEARLARRRRRSHTPVIHKARRPAVSFRVRLKK